MMETSGRVLGVLGGMGPLASAHFMLRLTALTPAQCDQDHVPAVLWSDPRVPDRNQAPDGTGPDPLPWLLRGLRGLEAAGCGAVAVPCNLAHRWFDSMQAATGLPILHIVDAAIAELRRHAGPGASAGLLATASTLRYRLFQDRLEAQGWPCLVPTEAEMAGLVTPAIAAVKANRVADAYAPLAEAARALAQRGAAAIVLGCTEIPLGLQGGPADAAGVPLVDTIDALARVAIAWARG